MTKVDTVPALTKDILKRIIVDAVELCNDIEKVGVIGSFARGTTSHTSDVDLLLKVVDTTKYSVVLDVFGSYVQRVLDYQFNKRLDIVNYDVATKRAAATPMVKGQWYHQEGYQEMLKEVVWLYER